MEVQGRELDTDIVEVEERHPAGWQHRVEHPHLSVHRDDPFGSILEVLRAAMEERDRRGS